MWWNRVPEPEISQPRPFIPPAYLQLRLSRARGFMRDRMVHVGRAVGWLVLMLLMAGIVGTVCAGFLWALDAATATRIAHPGLLYALPLAGVAVALVYHRFGRAAEGGNNLIVDQIHEAGGGVPFRMAPLILAATIASHLFGASVGREGTAVQIGGSIASLFCRLGLAARNRRILLTTGIAAGFGAVFGTPIAGAVFALEVLTIGRVEYVALVPALAAAIIADRACQAWGIHHVAYHIGFGTDAAGGPAGGGPVPVDPLLLAKIALAGIAFGLASLLFSEATHRAGALFKRICPTPWLRPAIGGVLTIGLVSLTGTTAYLGLGVMPTTPDTAAITGFFGPHIFAWAWLWKIAFTVVAIGTGFKGGEVTPLFFIGAGLGNALSSVLYAPTDLLAGLGFVAIFAGAANTPLACTLMGVELFGSGHAVAIAVACFVAYLCSGHSGIYLSQRIGTPKTADPLIPPDVSLRHARALRPAAAPDFAFRSIGQEPDTMPQTHTLSAEEIGMIRIYLKPSERHRPPGTGRLKAAFTAKPAYQELVLRAKRAGLVNATAHHTHFGFSNHGHVQESQVETGNPELTMCVEIIGARAKLEAFCHDHAVLLRGKVIAYKHIEQWRIEPGGQDVRAEEADPAELRTE